MNESAPWRNPRNIIVDICVNNAKGWDDNSIRSFVRQGYTIYKIRKHFLTISGKGTFGEQAGSNSDTISYYRIKFPYSEQGKQMITWMMMQIGTDFQILDTTHRKEICFEDS